ncbi:hypothetical protein JRQ81_003541 [Phrynocephalus forsythii]|uniref:Short myomegalin-like EB1 binding protein N-terminal domain-containing protein n=1 Tax=Phrynocephalus forsythii TaxID=171643 RepID=A0A9Q0XK30_9SAUR|nr:hypothetical protein JRQ81_003541 [Phrynocephalus forsythii]
MESPNNFCRLCGATLRGNHRRWLFGRSGSNSRPDLMVVLSYILDQECPQRGDGRGEFLCGKCAQALGRVYRFDTVIARVQALSIDRLQRLLSEKDQLARSLRYIHERQFPEGQRLPPPLSQEFSASLADLPHVRYQRLLQDDMALSEYECWASDADSSRVGTPCRNRSCQSCHGLRVEDADYEWVCRTPRRLGVSSPIFPLCRDKSQSMPTVHRAGSRLSLRSQSLGEAESCSMLSLETSPEVEMAWVALRALRSIGRKQLRAPEGSKIPVLAGNRRVPTPQRESPLGEEAYEEMVDEFVPLELKLRAQQALHQDLKGTFDNLKERLKAAEEELQNFQEKAQEAPDSLVILQSLGSPGAKPSMLEALLKQMARRLKERDQVLETLSSHLLALESVHREVRHLQEALKDKDADLARLNSALRTGEDTLHALHAVLQQKNQDIQRLESLCASTHESWRQREQTLLLTLKEKEALVKALQEALTSSTKDVEALANSLSSPDFAPGLLQRIQEKEDLLGQALAGQEQIIAQWQRRLQETEDDFALCFQEQLRQRSQDAREQAQEMEQLRRRLVQAEAKLAQGAVTLEEHQRQLAMLKEVADAKDRLLETFLREGEEKDRILRKLQEHWLKRTRQVAGGQGMALLAPTPTPNLNPFWPGLKTCSREQVLGEMSST